MAHAAQSCSVRARGRKCCRNACAVAKPFAGEHKHVAVKQLLFRYYSYRIPARLLVIQNLSTSSSVLRVAGAHCASADAVATTQPRRCSSPPLRRCAACVGDGNTVANPLSLEEAVAAAPLRRCTAFVYRPACLSSSITRPGTRKALSTSD